MGFMSAMVIENDDCVSFMSSHLGHNFILEECHEFGLARTFACLGAKSAVF
mgnify:CR=1 FL=1